MAGKRVEQAKKAASLAEALLSLNDIKAFLRGADDVVLNGGPDLLIKLLKGSDDRQIKECYLNKTPSYGYCRHLTTEEITNKVNWLIRNGFLEVRNENQIQTLAFTKKGWQVERNTFADEVLEKLEIALKIGNYRCVNYLKSLNTSVLITLLEKIKITKDRRFIPLLNAWKEIEDEQLLYAIKAVITSLSNEDRARKVVINMADYRKS